MDHAEEVFQGVLPSHHPPAEMLAPGKQPFDLPTAAFSAAVVWRYHLHTRLRQFAIEPVRVVDVAPNEAPQRFGNDDLGERLLRQRHFVRRSAFVVSSSVLSVILTAERSLHFRLRRDNTSALRLTRGIPAA